MSSGKLPGARRRALPVVCLALLVALLVAGCAKLLGIQERELASEADYSAQGYAGCVPGADCTRCLFPAHLAACQAGLEPPEPSVCDDLAALDQCTRCACGGCEQQLDACLERDACAAIWLCINATKCELKRESDTSCFRADQCRDVILENGGDESNALLEAAAVRSCAAEQGCLVCQPPTPAPPAGCESGSCQNCDTCMQTCLCSGDTYSTCQAACGEAQDPCGAGDACASCSTCLDTCTCQGGRFAECVSACRNTCQAGVDCSECGSCVDTCICNGGDATACQADCAQGCSAGTTCDGCTDCVEQCLCEGGTSSDCETRCAGEPSTPQCLKGLDQSRGACDACSGCVAQCTCQGTPAGECVQSCGMPYCSACGECAEAPCVCEESAARECLNSGGKCGDDACTSCACGKCPTELALCEQFADCPEAFRCMRQTGCQGYGPCREQCLRSSGGILSVILSDDESEQIWSAMEALKACTDAVECSGC